MADWVTLLQTFGLPTFMCLWFMFRLEKLIAANTNVLAVVAQLLPDQKTLKIDAKDL